jgi:hypothetical protein
MEIEGKSENAHLNRLVATTVLIISVFLAIEKVKDDNIVNDMTFTKSDAVDVWNQYQAERIKLHEDENTSGLLAMAPGADQKAVAHEQDRLAKQVTKYTNESAQLFVKARGEDVRYGELDFHHDQFVLSDALLSIALALTAVSALSGVYWLMVSGWVFGGLGALMGLAGFAGWAIHFEFFSRLMG